MASLLTVSGQRIELEPNRSYIMGRSAKCDLVVQDVASSRKHEDAATAPLGFMKREWVKYDYCGELGGGVRSPP